MNSFGFCKFAALKRKTLPMSARRTLFIIFISISISGFSQAKNLTFQKLLWIADSIKVCPKGVVWEIQSVMNTDESLKQGAEPQFIAICKVEPDKVTYNQMTEKKQQIWMNGYWMFPAAFPFYVNEGTKLSSGHKKRWIAIAVYTVD